MIQKVVQVMLPVIVVCLLLALAAPQLWNTLLQALIDFLTTIKA